MKANNFNVQQKTTFNKSEHHSGVEIRAEWTCASYCRVTTSAYSLRGVETDLS